MYSNTVSSLLKVHFTILKQMTIIPYFQYWPKEDADDFVCTRNYYQYSSSLGKFVSLVCCTEVPDWCCKRGNIYDRLCDWLVFEFFTEPRFFNWFVWC